MEKGQVHKSEQIIASMEARIFAQNLIGETASWVWPGHGSAIFIEFGRLTDSERRYRDGSKHPPTGEFTLMIEWSWRIEGRKYIICGSWSEDEIWQKRTQLLRGQRVQDLIFWGHFPEIQVAFSNAARLISFQTSEGYPAWAIFDNRGSQKKWLSWQAGNFVFGA